MTPFQRFAAFDGAVGRKPTAAWLRTAPALRAWAAKAATGWEQSEMLCEHLIRVWCRPALALVPELAEHAAALRAAPCAADWAETARIAGAVKSVVRYSSSGSDNASDAAYDAAYDAACSNVAYAAAKAAHDVAWAAAWADEDSSKRKPLSRSPWPQATEEWILLARPAVPPLYAALLDPHASPEPDAYAVAWDALAARLDTGDTDDALRIRDGVDASGAPVPTWARRTALARCLVRLELSR